MFVFIFGDNLMWKWGCMILRVRLIKWCKKVWFGIIIEYVKFSNFVRDWIFCRLILWCLRKVEIRVWYLFNFFCGKWVFIKIEFSLMLVNEIIWDGLIVFLGVMGMFK